MNDAWSKFNARPRLTAAICFAYAVATVASLNAVLPREMPHRHSIGWAFLLVALCMVAVGIVALRGREIYLRVKPVWDGWSAKRRIAVGASLYIGGYVVGFIACHAYDAYGKRWLKLLLLEEIAWWCQ